MKSSRKPLADALNELMKASRLNSAPLMEKETAKHGLKVGRSTIERVRNLETPVNLDALDAIAACFGKAAWQLIQPRELAGRPPLPDAFDVVIAAIAALPQDKRNALAADMELLARAPNDPDARQRVLMALVPASIPGVETHQLAGKPPNPETPQASPTLERDLPNFLKK